LRSSLLIAVAKPQLSFGSFALFPADPLFRGPIARRRDCRPCNTQVLERVRLVNPQYCSTYSSRTCNNPRHHSPKRTVIRPRLSA